MGIVKPTGAVLETQSRRGSSNNIQGIEGGEHLLFFLQFQTALKTTITK